jgi:hypothetical protein
VTYQLCVDRTGQMLIQYTGPTWMEEVEDGTKTVSVCTYYWNGVVTSLSLSARLTYGVFYAHGQIPAALAFAASSTHLYLAGIDDTNTMICAYDGTIQTEMGGAPSLLSSPTDSWLSYYTSLDASAAATNFTADLKNLVALGNKVAGSAGSDLFLMQTPDVALSVTLTVTKQNGQIVTLKPTATATSIAIGTKINSHSHPFFGERKGCKERSAVATHFYVVNQNILPFFDKFFLILFYKLEEDTGSAGEQPVSNKAYGIG